MATTTAGEAPQYQSTAGFASLSSYPVQDLPPAHRDYAYQMQNTLLLLAASHLAVGISAAFLFHLVRAIEQRQQARRSTHIFE